MVFVVQAFIYTRIEEDSYFIDTVIKEIIIQENIVFDKIFIISIIKVISLDLIILCMNLIKNVIDQILDISGILGKKNVLLVTNEVCENIKNNKEHPCILIITEEENFLSVDKKKVKMTLIPFYLNNIFI